VENSVDAHIYFSFKGESYDLKTAIDLDDLIEKTDTLPNIHRILAKQNNIDTYSYLYEVMESHEVTYDNAIGIAVTCINGNLFDMEKFRQLWQEQKEINIVQTIAKQYLNIEDLNQQSDIKSALLEAFRQGKNS